MTTTRACALLLVALAACARPDSEMADTAGATTMAAEGGRAARAAAISNAIAANPAAADSILRANGLTAQEFDRMLYDIASDSAESAAYAAARTP